MPVFYQVNSRERKSGGCQIIGEYIHFPDFLVLKVLIRLCINKVIQAPLTRPIVKDNTIRNDGLTE